MDGRVGRVVESFDASAWRLNDLTGAPHLIDAGVFAQLFNPVLAGVFLAERQDDGFRIIFANDMLGIMVGQPGIPLSGLSPSQILPAGPAQTLTSRLTACLRRQRQLSVRDVLAMSDGQRSWQLRLRPLDSTRVLGSCLDISDQITAEASVKKCDQELAALVSNGHVALLHCTLDGLIFGASEALAGLLGKKCPDFEGRPLSALFSPGEAELSQEALRELSLGVRTTYRAERRLQSASGDTIPTLLSVAMIRDPGGRPQHLMIVAERVAEDVRRRPGREGLLDAASFAAEVDRRLGVEPTPTLPAGLLAIGFKDSPDLRLTLGLSADATLSTSIAARVQAVLRGQDLVGELGPDLFAVLLSDLTDPNQAALAAERIVAQFGPPLAAGTQSVPLRPVIGLSLYPTHGTTATTLMRHAGAALAFARDPGHGTNVAVYTPARDRSVMSRLSQEERLRRAIESEAFIVHYQPLVDMRTLQANGLEALVRWQDEGRRIIPPNDFIPLAESTGLIRPLGELVLRQTCRQIAAWREAGTVDLPISVNLSAHQLSDPRLARTVLDIMAEYGVGPDRLKLELTESVLFQCMGPTHTALQELHEAGLRFLLDDFGTGYSSLSYLQKFPIETIKIDRSFVQNMTDDDAAAAIVRAIVTMGHALHLHVVAEGVETPEQLTNLRDLGCDTMQGYLISRPVDAETTVSVVARHTGPGALTVLSAG